MSQPQWKADLQELKPISKLFNWHLNILLMTPKPGRVALAMARRADNCFRNDASGWSGPAALSKLFEMLEDTRKAAVCRETARRVMEAQSQYDPLESHITPIHRYQVEIVSLTDPETFTLQEEKCAGPAPTDVPGQK